MEFEKRRRHAYGYYPGFFSTDPAEREFIRSDEEPKSEKSDPNGMEIGTSITPLRGAIWYLKFKAWLWTFDVVFWISFLVLFYLLTNR
jgi:hypothetical protein